MNTVVKEYLEKVYRENEIVGMSVGITDKQKTLAIYNFGERDIRIKSPIEDDTVFRIASITKIVLGLTAMKLVEQGILELNQGVKKYVPWLDDKVGELTLRSLLSHTGGLPMEYTPEGTNDESLLEQSLKDELQKIDLEKVGNGKPYLYSNLGIRLVSLIAEKVTGERFSSLSNRLIIQPLGMNNTYYSLERALSSSISLPHKVIEDKMTPVKITENAVRLGAGGLFSSANDLCVLARFMLNKGINDKGEKVLDEDKIDQMQTRIVSVGGEDFYGLTQMLHSFRGRHLGGHRGSAPPYCSNLAFDNESGYGVCVLINTDGKEDLRNIITDNVLDKLLDKEKGND